MPTVNQMSAAGVITLPGIMTGQILAGLDPVEAVKYQIVIAAHPQKPGMLLVKRAARQLPGGWWLESDNPGAGAVDSRSFGPVPVALIHARMLLRYWPR